MILIKAFGGFSWLMTRLWAMIEEVSAEKINGIDDWKWNFQSDLLSGRLFYFQRL